MMRLIRSLTLISPNANGPLIVPQASLLLLHGRDDRFITAVFQITGKQPESQPHEGIVPAPSQDHEGQRLPPVVFVVKVLLLMREIAICIRQQFFGNGASSSAASPSYKTFFIACPLLLPFHGHFHHGGIFCISDQRDCCVHLHKLSHFVRSQFKVERIKVFFDSSLMNGFGDHDHTLCIRKRSATWTAVFPWAFAMVTRDGCSNLSLFRPWPSGAYANGIFPAIHVLCDAGKANGSRSG